MRLSDRLWVDAQIEVRNEAQFLVGTSGWMVVPLGSFLGLKWQTMKMGGKICLVAKSCPTLLRPHGLYVACQAPLSMGLPWQEYWSGLLFPSPGDLPDPALKPMSQVLAAGFFTIESPGKPGREKYIWFYPSPFFPHYTHTKKTENQRSAVTCSLRRCYFLLEHPFSPGFLEHLVIQRFHKNRLSL